MKLKTYYCFSFFSYLTFFLENDIIKEKALFVRQTFTFVDATIITVEVSAFTSICHQKIQFSQ